MSKSNLVTTVYGFANTGTEDKLYKEDVGNGSSAIKIAINSEEKDENGKEKYPTVWVQIYVRDETQKAILKGALNSGKLMKFVGFASASGYLDKENKPQGQLIVNAFEISVMSSKNKSQEDATDFPHGDGV